LKSDAESFVHVAFFDHGAAGLIAFPKGEMHKSELQSILQQMSDDQKFKKLVFYLETCESGSMFVGMNISNLYALSAANPTESSWGTYCGSDAKVNGKSIGSCLGDLFSVSWMEDTDAQDTTKEDLQTQFTTVKQLTTKSQVMQWGDLSFTSDAVSEFVGGLTPNAIPMSGNGASVSARQLELYQVYHNYVSAEASDDRLSAGEQMLVVLTEQLEAEKAYENFLSIVYEVESQRESARRGKALPDNMECEMTAHSAFVDYGKFDANSAFAMQFHQYVVNVCADANVRNVDIAATVARACSATVLA